MKRAVNQPVTVALTVFAGIYAKAYTVPDEGTLLPQHSHETGHITAVTSGAVRVWQEEHLLGDFNAPALLSIPAHTMHQFLSLTPAVGLMCIHNADHADPDGEPPIAAENSLELED
jgi:hypothetical protein